MPGQAGKAKIYSKNIFKLIVATDKCNVAKVFRLSEIVQGKSLSISFDGQELVEIFQTMHPILMKLYAEELTDEVYE